MSFQARRHQPSRPRLITARFSSTCAETGRVIAKGEQCYYFPDLRKVYHLESNTAATIRGNAWNRAHNMPDAEW